RRYLIPVVLILAACGDSTDPLPSGPIRLTAEVRHVDPGNFTCEYRLTADADDLVDEAEWLDATLVYSRIDPIIVTAQQYWWPKRTMEPNEIYTGPWHGHGDVA